MTERNDITQPVQDTVGDGEPLVADHVQIWRCACCGDVTIAMYRNGKAIAEAAFGSDDDVDDFISDALDALDVEVTRQ